MRLTHGELSFRQGKGNIVIEVKGYKPAEMVIGGETIEGKPIEGRFIVSVEQFMDMLFTLYGVEEKLVLNMDNRRIEVGRSEDPYLKFSDFSRYERSIIYLSPNELAKVLTQMDTIRCTLDEVRFIHISNSKPINIRYDKTELHFVSEEESEKLYGFSLTLFREIIRNSFNDELGFLTFGAGKISLTKPSGRISVGGSWKDTTETTTFIYAEGVNIPKLTAKVYLTIR